jgi:hypothetical protein
MQQKDQVATTRNIFVAFCKENNMSLDVDRVSFLSVGHKIQILNNQNHQFPIVRKGKAGNEYLVTKELKQLIINCVILHTFDADPIFVLCKKCHKLEKYISGERNTGQGGV